MRPRHDQVVGSLECDGTRWWNHLIQLRDHAETDPPTIGRPSDKAVSVMFLLEWVEILEKGVDTSLKVGRLVVFRRNDQLSGSERLCESSSAE